ncbi:HlyD family type I secretion periplasmic adaptor subunit [Limnohabitans sp.]|uniref:HlyD family type I secretion periplasmic adaptor subunit n=1 Tax=Limnohabitans sp. TaxID=1907725 RepID=UPI00286F0F05|nr:HlyD family type I secretion periplasmic adaptor subunit [Limnohabitans sp.]
MSEVPKSTEGAGEAVVNEAMVQKPVALNPFSSAALAMQIRPPSYVVRMTSLGICAMTAVALLFACFAAMDIVVSAQGKVIPAGKSKVIQPLEPGVVRAVHVRDGQAVRAGDVLIELDPTSTGADRDRVQREYWEAQADVLRATAQLGSKKSFVPPTGMPAEIVANQNVILQGRHAEQLAKMASLDADMSKRRADVEAIQTNVTQLQSSLPLIEQKFKMREDLAKTGHIAQTTVIDSKLEFINAQKELAVQGSRLKESTANYQAAVEQRSQALAEFKARTSTELVEAVKKRDAAHQELIKANQRWAQQTLRAPIDGVVQQLAVTTVGGVVTAAQPLLTVVPENTPLEIEAQVMNRDVGHLHAGQRVINKIETYDFTRYGYIEGEVLWVGTDAVQDQKLGLVYPVRIKLTQTETPNAVNGRKGLVTAGMNVTADIRTDERRLIEYLLAPMLRYKQEALRER